MQPCCVLVPLADPGVAEKFHGVERKALMYTPYVVYKGVKLSLPRCKTAVDAAKSRDR